MAVTLLGLGLVVTATLVAVQLTPGEIDRAEDPKVAEAAAAEDDQPRGSSKGAGPSEADRAARSTAPFKVVPGLQLKKAPEEPEEPEADALREAAEQEARREVPISFKVGSFNVLGSQHTQPGGIRASWPPASTRTAGAAAISAEHAVDVLGTQELQADQLRDLQNRTGMAAWPGFAWGEAETDNSILWDPGLFELVEGSQFTITFMGRPRPQAIVRLRHLDTGREFYVVNTHPSAGDGRYTTERRNGQYALVNVVNDLQTTGLPVIVTGDMNDRAAFYCNVVPAAGLVASNGGSYGSGCQPPPEPIAVDWVVGSGVTWSTYWRDTRPIARKISNHFFISATANLG